MKARGRGGRALVYNIRRGWVEWNGMEGLRLANTSAVRNRSFVLVLKDSSPWHWDSSFTLMVPYKCYSIIMYSVMELPK